MSSQFSATVWHIYTIYTKQKHQTNNTTCDIVFVSNADNINCHTNVIAMISSRKYLSIVEWFEYILNEKKWFDTMTTNPRLKSLVWKTKDGFLSEIQIKTIYLTVMLTFSTIWSPQLMDVLRYSVSRARLDFQSIVIDISPNQCPTNQ